MASCCCTARRWRSAWCRPSRCRRASGLCPPADVARLRAHLAAVGLPTDPRAVRPGGFDGGRDAGSDGPRQEGRRGQHPLRPRPRHRCGVRQRPGSFRGAPRRPRPRHRLRQCQGRQGRTIMLLTIIEIILLLAANGFFVAAEFAIVKVRGIRIEALAEQGNVVARMSLRILRNVEAYLSACQLGITMASLGLGWIGEPAVSALLEPWLHPLGLGDAAVHTISFLLGFLIFSSLHIVVGEQVPKTFAIRKAEPMTLWIAYPLHAFYLLCFPLNWLLNKASRAHPGDVRRRRGQPPRRVLRRGAARPDRRLARARHGAQAGARHAGRHSRSRRRRGQRHHDPPQGHREHRCRRAARSDLRAHRDHAPYALPALARRPRQHHRRAARQGPAGAGPQPAARARRRSTSPRSPRRPGSSRTPRRCCTSSCCSASGARTWRSWSTSTAR